MLYDWVMKLPFILERKEHLSINLCLPTNSEVNYNVKMKVSKVKGHIFVSEECTCLSSRCLVQCYRRSE